MSHLLFYYQRPEPATWVFLSSFLLLSIYFVFHRFFSVRNLDVMLLLLLAPGLMMVYEGRRMKMAEQPQVRSSQLVDRTAELSRSPGSKGKSVRPVSLVTARESLQGPEAQNAQGISTDKSPVKSSQDSSGELQSSPAQSQTEPTGQSEQPSAYPPKLEAKKQWTAESLQFWGFIALLGACTLLLIRVMVDPALVRRPLLTPNLSIGGLSFIGISLFVFLMGNVVTSSPREQELRSPQLGPGYLFLKMLPQLPTTPDAQQDEDESDTARATSPVDPVISAPVQQSRLLSNLARAFAILSNLAIILSIVGVGYWHFDNVKTGIGCAVMYLLLPYTAQMTGNLEHVVPAAFMALALLSYRQPLLSGALMGFAAGLVYYPLFLLPLWISFYWKRGLTRWLSGVCGALVLLAGLLLLQGWQEFLDHLTRMFGLWLPRMEGLEGIWGPGRIQADFRLPVLVAFFLLSFSYAAWPSRKNLGTLISGTAAVMLAAQFWHGNGGGLYMAWFLPFVMLTIFRPNLDDRIATSVVYDRRSAVTG